MNHGTRWLGPLQVSPLGLGCMGMSTAYGRPDEASSKATLERALERGVTLFDTADMYGHGANEELLGRHLSGVREQIVLATKTGILSLPGLGLPIGLDASPARIARAADASLRRLRTEVIDLYYLHRVDPRVPIEESIGAMAELVRAGKVRALGVSEVTADELRRAHAVHPIAAAQLEWSLFSRDPEHSVVPTAHELGIGVVAYSPLGRGMLTGSPAATTRLSLLDYRRLLPRWNRSNLAENLRQADLVRQIADEVGARPAQVALAWLLGHDPDAVPIPGTKHPGYLDENLAALDLTLTAEQRGRLDRLRAAGDRYRSGPGAPSRPQSAQRAGQPQTGTRSRH
ncbi:MAG: aldo/keto reductase [Micropruina sp.]|uniref:aldo/keto reductase n=1 Tax=Micropruina sp. TaxID=2737536 RepID=UPI0039E405DA